MVAALLRVTGRTTIEAAAALGIHRNSLSDKIRGRRAFTEDDILTLAGYFDVPPGRLFEDPAELLGVQGTIKMNCGPIRPTLAVAA